MEFRDLRYFIDLVESESYHATAQKSGYPAGHQRHGQTAGRRMRGSAGF